MSRLAGAFDTPGLVGYLVAGHPTPDGFLANATALIESGCRVLEVGVPFSDPIADGPTIQTAVAEALQAGVRPSHALELTAQVREHHPDTPLVVMTYTNLAYRIGYPAFADQLRKAGVDGAILADMPPEEASGVHKAFGDDLDLIFLASPATSDARLDRLIDATRGFLYVVGLFGVTGARDELDPRTVELVERIAPKAHDHGTPVGVGFGISRGEHAQALVEAGADGIVVGSAFVRKAIDGDSPEALGELAAELVAGIEAAEPPERQGA